MAQKSYPVEWAAIGTSKLEEPVKPTPKVAKQEPKTAETDLTETSDLSPLERLRAVKGESSE